MLNSVLLTFLVATAPWGDVETANPREARVRLAQELKTGSLIVSRGDCLAVKMYSASAYTHVASVVVHKTEIYVYDATGGAGVRKQLLCDYLAGQDDNSLHPFHLCCPLSPEQAQKFEEHLECQLGRPYAIAHHLTGNRAEGLHCSEYATDALIAAGLMRARQPSRVSPATLVEGILKDDLYAQATTLQLVPDPPQRPDSDSWCTQIWFDTKQCTRACYLQLRAWFCCK
jgi:hypothetical protein